MKIVVANLGPKGGAVQARHLADLDPDYVLACEAVNRTDGEWHDKPAPRGLRAYQRGTGRGGRDTAIYTRHNPDQVEHVQLADGIEANDGGSDRWHRNAPPRWMMVLRADGVTYMSVHLHFPGPVTFRQWRASLVKLERFVRAEQGAGQKVVVGGDFNSIVRYPKTRSARSRVEAMFRGLGLHWYAPSNDVMWLAFCDLDWS